MLNRFHLILELRNPGRALTLMRNEHFDYQYAPIKRDDQPDVDGIIVVCKDFSDIGVVLDKMAGTYATTGVYFVDANHKVFRYDRKERSISTLGYMYPSSTNPLAGYNTHIKVGNTYHSFLEV